jgi:hypothetical protein
MGAHIKTLFSRHSNNSIGSHDFHIAQIASVPLWTRQRNQKSWEFLDGAHFPSIASRHRFIETRFLPIANRASFRPTVR